MVPAVAARARLMRALRNLHPAAIIEEEDHSGLGVVAVGQESTSHQEGGVPFRHVLREGDHRHGVLQA